MFIRSQLGEAFDHWMLRGLLVGLQPLLPAMLPAHLINETNKHQSWGAELMREAQLSDKAAPGRSLEPKQTVCCPTAALYGSKRRFDGYKRPVKRILRV